MARRHLYLLPTAAAVCVLVFGATIIWARWMVILALPTGLASAAALLGLRWFVRRHKKVAALLASLPVLIAIAVLALLAEYGSYNTSPPVKNFISVKYHGEGEVRGTQVVVKETIRLDQQFRDSAIDVLEGSGIDANLVVPHGAWRLQGMVDGFPSYTRTRTLPIRRASVAELRFQLDESLGSVAVEQYQISLIPRDGSQLLIDAPKGSVVATMPPGAVADIVGHREVATLGLDGYTTDVSVSLLAPPFRNPAGKVARDVVTWGPLPWLTGVLAGLLVFLLRWLLKNFSEPAGSPEHAEPSGPETRKGSTGEHGKKPADRGGHAGRRHPKRRPRSRSRR